MGRSILAEVPVEQSIKNLLNEKWTIGLLIGQVTEQKDYVVHIVPTPSEDEEAGHPGSLLTVTEGWVMTHAKQVMRMLPGGLRIIGVFALAPPDVMKKVQPKLRQMVFALSKTERASRPSTQKTSGSPDRVLLQICAVSHKQTCYTIDASNPRSTFNPAEWRYQSFVDQWSKLECTLTIDWAIAVSSLSIPLNQQMQLGLSDFYKMVWNSLATVNGRLLPGDKPLVSPQETTSSARKKKHASKTDTSAGPITIELFAQMISDDELQVPTTDECGAHMMMEGSIVGRAFVHAKATVQEAIQAVKDDLVYSLSSRCELLCEDLLQTEEEQDPDIVYETPIRVIAPASGGTITFCDYMFQDEAATDAAERFRDLLNLSVEPDNIAMNLERIPSHEDLRQAETRAQESFHISSSSLAAKPNSAVRIGGAVGIVAAVVAVMVGFYKMMFQSQETQNGSTV